MASLDTETGAGSHVRALYPLIIVPGIVLLQAPSTVETIMEQYGFRESLGGLLQVTYFAGGVVGILLITRMMQRYSVKRIIVSQVSLLSVSLLAAAASPWYPLLLFFYVFTGFANGVLITFPGVYVSRVCRETSHRAQTILYGFFSLGVVTGPLVVGLMLDNGISWRWAYAMPAILVIPLALPSFMAGFTELEGVKKLSREVLRRIAGFDSKMFYGLLLALLLYIAAESAVSMWLITFLHEEHGVATGAAHWILTALWAALTLGRWLCGPLADRYRPYHILTFLTLAAGVSLLAAPLTGSGTAAMLIYPLVGLFYSGIYPLLMGYVSWFPEDVSPSVFTMFVAAGAAGSTFLPYFVGLVNQFAGLVAGMCTISIPVFGVYACLVYTRRTTSGHGERQTPSE